MRLRAAVLALSVAAMLASHSVRALTHDQALPLS